MRDYRAKKPCKCKPKSKKKCKQNCKTNIDIKNNNYNLKIKNNNNIEILKKEYQDIISYLNYKTKSNFTLIEEYKNLISNLLNKYTINDIKTVIDKKTYEWGNNPKMKECLTPEILFGHKFERYLHQKEKQKHFKIYH